MRVGAPECSRVCALQRVVPNPEELIQNYQLGLRMYRRASWPEGFVIIVELQRGGVLRPRKSLVQAVAAAVKCGSWCAARMDSDDGMLRFVSTCNGSKRSFSLRRSEATRQRIALFAAVAADSIVIFDQERPGTPLELQDLSTSKTYVVDRVALVTPKEWISVCSVAEFEAKKNKINAMRVGLAGRDVAIIRLGTAWHCIDAVCYHFGGPLVLGDIEVVLLVAESIRTSH
jgi:hypothetical protein